VKVIAERLTGELTGGELTCLVGRNGTGKSTFLRTIAGLQAPLGGRVEVTPPRPSQGEGVGENSISIHSLSANERAKMIGVVLTQKPDVQNMTVEEVVGLGRTPYTGFFGTLSKADRAIVAEAMEQVGIRPLAQRNIQMLSDGERQKVMIAKALAQQTPVILLDEPTAFLDYPSKVEMMQMLRQMAKEMDKTIVLSTHDIELAAKIATRFLLLSEKGLQEVQASELLTSFSS
jgi:iron complex transport system ATP-binding protein